LFRILQEEGLERVSVLGLPFDRRSAELVRRRAVTDPDHDGLVVEELQGGHQLRGHIIRRAKVVVGEFAEEAAQPKLVVQEKEEPKAPPAPEPAPVAAAAEVTDPGPANAEEAIVVEDWSEPTHPGTPAAVLGLPVL